MAGVRSHAHWVFFVPSFFNHHFYFPHHLKRRFYNAQQSSGQAVTKGVAPPPVNAFMLSRIGFSISPARRFPSLELKKKMRELIAKQIARVTPGGGLYAHHIDNHIAVLTAMESLICSSSSCAACSLLVEMGITNCTYRPTTA